MTENDATRHDDVLFNIMAECKVLPVFLDHVFGFLSRRTDFYHVMEDSNSPVGLPEGLAESLLRRTFKKWQSLPNIEVTEDIPPSIAKEVVMESDNTKTGFSSSDSYNGAIYDSYCWSQTYTDVDVTLQIGTIPAKTIKVNISNDKISVKAPDKILLEGELCHQCKSSEAIWSVAGQKLQIHLDKSNGVWWNCLVKTEPKLDLANIDCSRPYEDMPEDAQAKIQELEWEQQQKRLGKPTREELVQQEFLRKSWNAEGSPFSGPFDPSKVLFH